MWVWSETRRITETVGSRSSSPRRANWRAATQAIQIRLLHSTSMPFWQFGSLGRKGVKDLSVYHFLGSQTVDWRRCSLGIRPRRTTNAPTGFVPFERQFENEPRDGRVVRVPEDDRTANQPGPSPGIPRPRRPLQEFRGASGRIGTVERSMTGLDRSAGAPNFRTSDWRDFFEPRCPETAPAAAGSPRLDARRSLRARARHTGE